MSMKKSLFTPRLLAQSGVIAAVYVALTLANPWSYPIIQARVSEVMAVLPLFTPAAVPGLIVGVFVANIASPFGLVDMIFGTVATAIAASMTYQIGKDLAATRVKELPTFLIAMIPPVVVNVLIVGSFLYLLSDGTIPFHLTMMSVGIGQIIACYGLGAILYVALRKIPLLNK